MRATVAIAVLLAGGVAHAEPSAPSAVMFAPTAAPTSSEDDDETYRSHVAITSALGLGMLVAVPMFEDPAPQLSDGLAVTGMLTSTLVPLVVHGLHGEPERGFASVGTRVAGFVGGMYAGKHVAGCADLIFCDQALWGGIVGLSVASAIDIAFYAKSGGRAQERVVVPTLTASPSGGQVGVAGLF
jgi:hypothetical protein